MALDLSAFTGKGNQKGSSLDLSAFGISTKPKTTPASTSTVSSETFVAPKTPLVLAPKPKLGDISLPTPTLSLPNIDYGIKATPSPAASKALNQSMKASEELAKVIQKPLKVIVDTIQNHAAGVEATLIRPDYVPGQKLDWTDTANVALKGIANYSPLGFMAQSSYNAIGSLYKAMTGKDVPKITVPALKGRGNIVETMTSQQYYDALLNNGVPASKAFWDTAVKTVFDMSILVPVVRELSKEVVMKTNPTALVDANITPVTRETMFDYFSGRKTPEELNLPSELRQSFADILKNGTREEVRRMLGGMELVDVKPSALGKILGISEQEAANILETKLGGAVRQPSAGALPGQAIVGVPQFKMGMSIQPVRKVGGAYPEEPIRPTEGKPGEIVPVKPGSENLPTLPKAPKAIQFVSPNVQENLTLDQAISNQTTQAYQQNLEAVQSSAQNVGLKTQTNKALGEWGDGAEETYIVDILNDVPDEQRIYSLALSAKKLNQKDAIDFKINPSGNDDLYIIDPNGRPILDVKRMLDENGIKYKTLGANQIFVVNQQGDYFDNLMLDKMSSLEQNNGLNIDLHKGTATFITKVEDRVAAQKIYDKIINDYENKPTNKFKGSSVSNLAVSGQGIGGTQKAIGGTTKIQKQIAQEIKPGSPKVVRTEYQLLKEKIKNQAKGARVGFNAGRIQTRDEIIGKLKTKLESQNQVKTEIVNYIKENLPVSERGVFLNMVKDAKTQTDLINAFTRIDAKAETYAVKEAISILKKTVSKITESDLISADYRTKIKEIIDEYELSGHNKVTIDKIKATQEYLNRQKSIGEDVELPQRILDRLKILERTPKDQLTLEKVLALQDEIELLATLGKTKWSSKQAIYEAEKDLRKEQLLTSATSINSRQVKAIGLEQNPAKYKELYNKARNYLQRTRLGLTPIEGLADITGMQPMKRVLDNDFGHYLTYNDEIIKQWYDLTKGFDETNFKRIGAYAMSKQSGGIERLANNEITQETIDNLKLTPEEMKAYDFARKTFDEEFPAVKKYALDTFNKDVGEVKNYVSFMSDNDAMSELEMYDRFGQSSEFPTRTKTVEKGFIEKRSEVSKAKLELNIDKIFRRHIDDVAYMLTMGKDIKEYFEIVNSPELRAKLGDVGSLTWLQWLDLMARKGGSEGAKRIAIIDTLRRNLAAGVMSFRISSALIQFTSFTDTLATIGTEWGMKGASSIATSKEWRNFVMNNFPEVKKAVGDDIAFREFGDNFLTKATTIGLTPLQKLDGLMRSTAVSGAYQKFAKEKGVAVDLNNPDPELIAKATKAMRQSQGSSFFKDQPLSITSNYGLLENKSLNKTILTFQSFMLARWDNMQRQMWRLGIKDKAYAKAFMSFFWMVLVASAMEESIRRGVKKTIAYGTGLVTGKEDSTDYGDFTQNAAMNIVQSVPLMGSLASGMEYGSNPVPVINTFEQVQSGLSSVWGGKALQTKLRGAITASGAAGTLAGVPGSSQVAQLLKGLVPPVNAKEKSNLPQFPSLGKLPTLPKLQSMPKFPKL